MPPPDPSSHSRGSGIVTSVPPTSSIEVSAQVLPSRRQRPRICEVHDFYSMAPLIAASTPIQ
jgi:hypothetical protein